MPLVKQSRRTLGLTLILFFAGLSFCVGFPARQIVNDKHGSFVQPDYQAWKKIAVGMTEEEVIELLGQPLMRSEDEPAHQEALKMAAPEFLKSLVSRQVFGWLKFSNPAVPHTFTFSVTIDYQRRVKSISDPFDGELSENGEPTTPRLMTPYDNASLQHFPHFVDFRWQPSAGEYPIEYHVEVESGQRSIVGGVPVEEFILVEEAVVTAPVYSWSFSGLNKARWRVKATNRLGSSKWSEYRYFQFKP